MVLACWVLVEFGSLLQWRMMFVDLFVMPQLADVLDTSMDNLSAVPQLTSQFPLHAIGTFDACDLYLSASMYDFRFFLLFFRRHRSTSLLSDFAYCYSKLSVHLCTSVVCLSTVTSWSHRLKFFENNFTFRTFSMICSLSAVPNITDLLQRKYPQNFDSPLFYVSVADVLWQIASDWLETRNGYNG